MRIKIHDELLPEGVSAADVLLALEIKRSEPSQMVYVVHAAGIIWGVYTTLEKAQKAAGELGSQLEESNDTNAIPVVISGHTLD